MAKVGKQSSPFEQSFMFHMIRDFFLLLVLVATFEMSILNLPLFGAPLNHQIMRLS